MLDPRWSSIMQEVDRLYFANTTSEGRIACITDYIIRLLNDPRTPAERVDDELAADEAKTKEFNRP